MESVRCGIGGLQMPKPRHGRPGWEELKHESLSLSHPSGCGKVLSSCFRSEEAKPKKRSKIMAPRVEEGGGG